LSIFKTLTSSPCQKTLGEVDQFAADLHIELAHRNLSDIVDVVFVSDHGMTDTSHPELLYIDDILGEGYGEIEHEDGMLLFSFAAQLDHSTPFTCDFAIGWPSMGLRFHPKANASHYLSVLLSSAQKNAEKFDVYTHDTMPQRYHFSNHKRIAPIYIVPKIGYALTTRLENGTGMSKGVR
jgi:predicted AlkP superfamily pyrophosphatase or phosphodiesterase